MVIWIREDWQASWIGHPPRFTHRSVPPAYLWRDFDLKETPIKARLYISARGHFETEINRQRIGNDAYPLRHAYLQSHKPAMTIASGNRHQPPFPHTLVRPNGSFRGLPPKAKS